MQTKDPQLNVNSQQVVFWNKQFCQNKANTFLNVFLAPFVGFGKPRVQLQELQCLNLLQVYCTVKSCIPSFQSRKKRKKSSSKYCFQGQIAFIMRPDNQTQLILRQFDETKRLRHLIYETWGHQSLDSRSSDLLAT